MDGNLAQLAYNRAAQSRGTSAPYHEIFMCFREKTEIVGLFFFPEKNHHINGKSLNPCIFCHCSALPGKPIVGLSSIILMKRQKFNFVVRVKSNWANTYTVQKKQPRRFGKNAGKSGGRQSGNKWDEGGGDPEILSFLCFAKKWRKRFFSQNSV